MIGKRSYEIISGQKKRERIEDARKEKLVSTNPIEELNPSHFQLKALL